MRLSRKWLWPSLVRAAKMVPYTPAQRLSYRRRVLMPLRGKELKSYVWILRNRWRKR